MSLDARDRTTLAAAARPLAKITFGAVIVVSPFRGRIEVLDRPSPPLYGDYTDLLVFWSEVAVLLTIGLWAVALVAENRWRRVDLGPPFLALPVAGLIVVAALGIPTALDPALAAWNTVRLLVLATLALYVLNEFESISQLRTPLAAMLLVQALVTFAQVAGQHSAGLQWLGEHDLAPSLPVSVVTAADGSRLVRGYGLTDHPNILGGLLAFAMLLLAMPRTDGGSTTSARWLAALGSAALLLTFSRAAVIAFGTGLLVAIAMGILAVRPEVRRVVVRPTLVVVAGVVLACLPVIAAYAPYALARVALPAEIATEARSIDERDALTVAATEVFLAHPVLGVGLGGLPQAIRRAAPDFPFTYQPAHVVAVDVAAETGAVGGLLYLGLVVSPWLAVARHRTRWTPQLIATTAALGAVTVVGLFDHYTWSSPAGGIWNWLVLGAWAATARGAQVPVTAGARGSRPATGIGLAGA